MSTKPAVSIIMPAYNAEKTIAESIQSVLNQTFRDWELIIINDGSSDSTSTIVIAYEDPRIILLEQQNSGVAEARNTGIQDAKGDWIAFLDSDDLWLNKKLEKFVAFIEKYPKKGLIYSNTRFFTEDPKISKPYNQWKPFVENTDYETLLIYDYISTLTVMVKREVFKAVGLFDANFFGTEDWDMWLRITEKYPIGFLTEELSLYREHAQGISKKFERQHIEEYKVIKKYLFGEKKIKKSIKNKALWIWYSKEFLHELKHFKFLSAGKVYFNMLLLLPMSNTNFIFPLLLIKNYLKRLFIVSK